MTNTLVPHLSYSFSIIRSNVAFQVFRRPEAGRCQMCRPYNRDPGMLGSVFGPPVSEDPCTCLTPTSLFLH